MGGIDKTDDPFAIFHTPPPNETEQERRLRERREAEAQRVSDLIDDGIKAEKAALKKKQKDLVKVLLLGQSESGKSTTLKNFRMKYAREAWKQERASWRAVIQLNLVRSIITIVETLQAEMNNETVAASPLSPMDLNVDDVLRASMDVDTPVDTPDPSDVVPLSVLLTEKHQLLKLRLGPLRRVETDLRKRLGAGTEEIVGVGSGVGVVGVGKSVRSRSREFGVRGWKDALDSQKHNHPLDGKQQTDDATEVIVGCKDDMKALWADETVRAVLTKQKIRVEDSAGFFLDDLERIATRTYEPSDDDVVRARLRTVGVQEYRISFGEDHGNGLLEQVTGDVQHEWIIYDVGGSRTMRQAWLPFFDTVDAIIFLAPVSCFDERLLEDPDVNRLEDSLLLWRAICASKLLKATTMILFLNKCDILKRKLKSGTQVRKFLPSYGDRSNDAQTFVKYLREKFRDILKQHSHTARHSYFHSTSVTDTKATAITLRTVRDSILIGHLKTSDLV